MFPSFESLIQVAILLGGQEFHQLTVVAAVNTLGIATHITYMCWFRKRYSWISVCVMIISSEFQGIAVDLIWFRRRDSRAFRRSFLLAFVLLVNYVVKCHGKTFFFILRTPPAAWASIIPLSSESSISLFFPWVWTLDVSNFQIWICKREVTWWWDRFRRCWNFSEGDFAIATFLCTIYSRKKMDIHKSDDTQPLGRRWIPRRSKRCPYYRLCFESFFQVRILQ